MKNTAKTIEKISGICLGVFLFAAIIIIIFSGISCDRVVAVEETSSGITDELSLDPNAKQGNIKGKTREEIVKELNDAVDAGRMTVTINSNPQVDITSGMANINIVNIEGNPFAQQLEIKYEGETIYKSGLIPVGSYIENAKLNVDLPIGSYKCTAYINGISADGKIMGTVSAKIRLDVCDAA